MDRRTVEAYEARGERWSPARRPQRLDDAQAFAARLGASGAVVDLGSGTGRHLDSLGRRAIGLDAAWSMLRRCRAQMPDALLVRADFEALPFGAEVLAGAWSNMTYHHVPAARLPAALAELHRVLDTGAPVDLQVLAGGYSGHALAGDEVGDRYFAGWQPDRLADVLVGAGFEEVRVERRGEVLGAGARRARTLADSVGADMRLLVVGLNPSVVAADAGVPFFRRGNRFWPAALAAGLVHRDRDPRAALGCGLGFTDLVKRASPNARSLGMAEYREGMARVERLARWLAPAAVCVVGLAGWRAAFGQPASAGVQEREVGGRPAYLMPSTSGANAHVSQTDLTEHLRQAAKLAEQAEAVRERVRTVR
jgi:double-stranded uracil-DNA glycosylase